jgi:hypothetical protein
LDGPLFHRLFKIVILAIAKTFTNMREAVTLRQHLSIALHYLAIRSTSEDLKFESAVDPHFNRNIVLETCLMFSRQAGTG